VRWKLALLCVVQVRSWQAVTVWELPPGWTRALEPPMGQIFGANRDLVARIAAMPGASQRRGKEFPDFLRVSFDV